MATLSQLVDVVANVEGIDSERVSAIARAVREQGLIATGGRGTSAARMNERDAANLLIAVNVADMARTVPEAVQQFRSLEAKRKKAKQEFGRMLEQVLFAAKIGSIPEYVCELVRQFESASNLLGRHRYPQAAYDLRVEFEKPKPSALFQILVHPQMAFVHFVQAPGTTSGQVDGDRKQRISISHRTLFAVAEALRT